MPDMPGARVKTAGAVLLAAVLLVGVADAAASPQSRSRHKVRKLPGYCSETRPCHFRQGRYRLGSDGVIPGLRLTLPRGWSSTGNDTSGLNLIPPGHRPAQVSGADQLFVWVDLRAVETTGTVQFLTNVGKTPPALISWLTTNPAVEVVSPPRPKRLARRIPATTLTIGVSSSANYIDTNCPSYPRCADLFRSYAWRDPASRWGLGYPEEAQLFLASIKRGKQRHTVFVALDAANHSDLTALRKAMHSVISSFRLPKAVTPG